MKNYASLALFVLVFTYSADCMLPSLATPNRGIQTPHVGDSTGRELRKRSRVKRKDRLRSERFFYNDEIGHLIKKLIVIYNLDNNYKTPKIFVNREIDLLFKDYDVNLISAIGDSPDRVRRKIPFSMNMNFFYWIRNLVSKRTSDVGDVARCLFPDLPRTTNNQMSSF